jgi:hypothetical protein
MHENKITLDQEWYEDSESKTGWNTLGWNVPEGYELCEILDIDKHGNPTLASFIKSNNNNTFMETEHSNEMTTEVKIQKAVEELFNSSRGRWISVKDMSFTFFLKKYEIYTPAIASAFSQTLVDMGIIEKKGVGLGTEYKTLTGFIPDLSAVSQKVMDACHLAKDGYPYSSSSDLRPERKRRAYKKREKSNTKVIERVFNLKDLKFFIKNDCIVQGKVIGTFLDGNDKVNVRLEYFDTLSGEIHEKIDLLHTRVYDTVDQCLLFLKSSVVVYK